MTDMDELPPEIGPHEGEELERMLAGSKPAAMFYDVVPPSIDWGEDNFAPHVDAGEILKSEFLVAVEHAEFPEVRYVYYSLPGEEWRMNRLREISQALNERGESTTPELEREIGELLGYSDREIQVFLDRFFDTERK